MSIGVDSYFFWVLEKLPVFLRDMAYDIIHCYVPKPHRLKLEKNHKRDESNGAVLNGCTENGKHENNSRKHGKHDNNRRKNGFVTNGNGAASNGHVEKHDRFAANNKASNVHIEGHDVQRLANRSGVRLLYAFAGVAKLVGRMLSIGGEEEERNVHVKEE